MAAQRRGAGRGGGVLERRRPFPSPLPFGRQWPRAGRTPLAQSRQVPLRVFPLGCCPRGWTLFRWKCLWASSEIKTWRDSKEDCERKSSRLLVLPEPWSARELWEAVGTAFTQMWSSWDSGWFWVGLNKETGWTWKWVDGSVYKGSVTQANYNTYAAMYNGQLSGRSSSWVCRFICEKAASPEDPPTER